MLSLEQCPGPEEVGLEEVQEWRECTSRESVQVDEGQSSWSWIYHPELGYIADKAKGVAGLKPE